MTCLFPGMHMKCAQPLWVGFFSPDGTRWLWISLRVGQWSLRLLCRSLEEHWWFGMAEFWHSEGLGRLLNTYIFFSLEVHASTCSVCCYTTPKFGDWTRVVCAASIEEHGWFGWVSKCRLSQFTGGVTLCSGSHLVLCLLIPFGNLFSWLRLRIILDEVFPFFWMSHPLRFIWCIEYFLFDFL